VPTGNPLLSIFDELTYVGSYSTKTVKEQRRLQRSLSKAAAIQKVEGVVFDPFNEVTTCFPYNLMQ
jgi:hypothetical protein